MTRAAIASSNAIARASRSMSTSRSRTSTSNCMPDDRREREHVLRVLTQAGDAPEHDVACRRRDADVGGPGRRARPAVEGTRSVGAGLQHVVDDLSDEERVAAGLPVHPVDELVTTVAEVLTRGGAHERRNRGRVETVERDAFHLRPGGAEVEVREHRGQRVLGPDLGRPVRREDHHPAEWDRTDDVAQQEHGRRCRPVHVVEDDDARRSRAGRAEPLHHRFEQPVLLRRRVGVQGRPEPVDP